MSDWAMEKASELSLELNAEPFHKHANMIAAAHGPAWELAKEAQRRALAAIREALQEPTWEMIDAIRMAWRTTQRPGVSGMTIDAQFAAEHAREYAVYRAMLSASFLKGET